MGFFKSSGSEAVESNNWCSPENKQSFGFSLSKVPTLIEGGLAGFEVIVWHGLYAPKGTPKAIVGQLATAPQASLKDPAFKTKFFPRSNLGRNQMTSRRGIIILETAVDRSLMPGKPHEH